MTRYPRALAAASPRLIVAAIVLLAAAAIWLSRGVSSSTPIEAGPFVQQLDGDSFLVAWDSESPRPLTFQVHDATGQPRDAQVVEGDAHRRVAHVEHLGPGESYTYRISRGDKVLAEHVVKTPAEDAPLNVVVFGDSGSGSDEQKKLGALMLRYDPQLVLHTGDLIYPHGERADYLPKFFEPYAEMIAGVPFYPCVGNHDFITSRGQPMFDVFELPANGPPGQTPERHYWFDFGRVRVVTIDSNLEMEVMAEEVAPWLDGVLSSTDKRWKIVIMHHPVYSHGRYGNAYRLMETLVPVFEAHDVALVLTGHNHLYQRTKPVRGGEVVEPGQGIVYVTTGAGGAELYELKPDPPAEFAVQFNTLHSFTKLEISDSSIEGRQIDINNEVIDTFSIPVPALQVAESTDSAGD